jgi:hypothetical protein
LPRKCGNLDVSQPYGPPWPFTGIALPFYHFGETNGFAFNSEKKTGDVFMIGCNASENGLGDERYWVDYLYVTDGWTHSGNNSHWSRGPGFLWEQSLLSAGSGTEFRGAGEISHPINDQRTQRMSKTNTIYFFDFLSKIMSSIWCVGYC